MKRRTVPREERVLPLRERVPVGYKTSDIVYEANSIYLATDKGERRKTGSYYTPDHIVNHMVEAALGPQCERIDRALRSEIGLLEGELARAEPEKRTELAQRLDALHVDFDDRVLRFRVLDPAMGSGHFLIRVCQYLAEEIATNPTPAIPLPRPCRVMNLRLPTGSGRSPRTACSASILIPWPWNSRSLRSGLRRSPRMRL